MVVWVRTGTLPFVRCWVPLDFPAPKPKQPWGACAVVEQNQNKAQWESSKWTKLI